MDNWEDKWGVEWYLIPVNGEFSVRTLLLVPVAVEASWDLSEIRLNRIFWYFENADCDIYGVDVWSPRLDLEVQFRTISNLGDHSIFLGHSYPRLMKISSERTGHDGGTFIKPGCVFLTSSRDFVFENIPNICCFQLDDSPMLVRYLNPNHKA